MNLQEQPSQSESDEQTLKLKSLTARAKLKRTQAEKFADKLISSFGTARSFVFHLIGFSIWMFINSGLLPVFPIYDPYPFVFMTTIMSIEAIFLAIFVLISQNRQTQTADLREEIDLQINLRSERENIKIIKMLAYMQHQLGMRSGGRDRELKKMKKPVSEDQIRRELEKELSEED